MTALAALLRTGRLVDLTQPLGPRTPLWPGSRPFRADVVARYEPDGFYARELAMPEHAGTHLDAPAHVDPDGARIHEIPLAALVRPAVVLDVRPWAAGDRSFVVEPRHVEAIEAREGPVPAGCAALVLTGWQDELDDPERYVGPGGETSFPGIGADAAALLLERGVAGVGVDTLSVDPGASIDHPAHRTLLPAGIWQLEGLVHLDVLPSRGAWLVVAPLLLVDGSGSPARVLAIVPADD